MDMIIIQNKSQNCPEMNIFIRSDVAKIIILHHNTIWLLPIIIATGSYMRYFRMIDSSKRLKEFFKIDIS